MEPMEGNNIDTKLKFDDLFDWNRQRKRRVIFLEKLFSPPTDFLVE